MTVKTRLTNIALAALFTALGATTALADSSQARYDVRLIGAKVGEMAMASNETAGASAPAPALPRPAHSPR